jgi:hypothetical protein
MNSDYSASTPRVGNSESEAVELPALDTSEVDYLLARDNGHVPEYERERLLEWARAYATEAVLAERKKWKDVVQGLRDELVETREWD